MALNHSITSSARASSVGGTSGGIRKTGFMDNLRPIISFGTCVVFLRLEHRNRKRQYQFSSAARSPQL